MAAHHPTARALALARSLVEALERLREEPSVDAGLEVLALAGDAGDAARAAGIAAICEHTETLHEAAEVLGIRYRQLCRMRDRGDAIPARGLDWRKGSAKPADP